ncbi:hypothetical protein Tco_0001682 [Tanacetum coccineum]
MPVVKFGVHLGGWNFDEALIAHGVNFAEQLLESSMVGRTLFTEYVQHFEDTLDQITGNLESVDVCWVRYRFLASTSPSHKFTPVAANDVSLEIETKEDNHSGFVMVLTWFIDDVDIGTERWSYNTFASQGLNKKL